MHRLDERVVVKTALGQISVRTRFNASHAVLLTILVRYDHDGQFIKTCIAPHGLDRAFENLSSDGSADAAVAANLHNEFASNKAMADYFLTQMDCREEMCRGEIRAMDGMPFDNDTLAALAVSLRELQPAGPYTVYVSGDDPTSARVFLTTGD